MVQRLSPVLTTYVVAGVTSTTGSVTSAPATGVPGRVGVKRTPPVELLDEVAVAGASGLKETGGEPADELSLVEPRVEPERFGIFIVGGASAVATVSVGAGAGLVVELQPGVAKMRTRAKKWMPTTMPKIFRIFIGRFGSRL